MHETSLGRTIQDYLTGDEIEETTYEEFRQGLCRMLVEEKGYPRESIRRKVPLSFSIEGKPHTVAMDYGIFKGDEPLLILVFCAGEVETYTRETVAGARLHIPPFPLALVTDTSTAQLVRTSDGTVLERGFHAIPSWERLQNLAGDNPIFELTPGQRSKEERLLYTYSGYRSCCGPQCSPEE